MNFCQRTLSGLILPHTYCMFAFDSILFYLFTYSENHSDAQDWHVSDQVYAFLSFL